MVRPIPVTVITGFLGAGKTTLIKRILRAPHGLSIGLVLNEIGQAGIDQVPEAELAYRELTQGCACCVRNPDLIAALREIGERGDIDRILFETSGLADPLPLTWSMTHPEIAELVGLDAVVVVLDAANRAGAAEEEWQAQVRSSDLAVLTKLDLAPPGAADALKAEALEINPQLRFIDLAEEGLTPLLLDLNESPRARTLEQRAPTHSDFRAVTLAGSERYRLDPLEDLLDALPPGVFRAKGIVPLAAGEWMSFHVVGGRVQVELDVRPPAHGEGRIALFGRRLDEPELRRLFRACQA